MDRRRKSFARRPRLAWGGLALLLCTLCQDAMAKIVKGEVALHNATQWTYLTKFSYSQGSGNFTLDVKAGKVSHTTYEPVLDTVTASSPPSFLFEKLGIFMITLVSILFFFLYYVIQSNPYE